MSLSIFPHRAKFIGIGLILLALPFAYLYFLGGKPDFFKIKVFALVSTYLETRYFVLVQTNVLDELSAILFISGLSLASFSKEKMERPEYEQLRLAALVKALFITLILWLFSFLLVYGMAIFMVSFSIFLVFMLLFNLLFRISLHKRTKQLRLLL